MIDDDIEWLRQHKKNARFDDLLKICEAHFGRPRFSSGHYIFPTPWPLDPRVNLQCDKKNKKDVKPYQVNQVIRALEKLKESTGDEIG